MKIFIIYATNSGGTQMTAEEIGKTLTEKHHEVVIKDVKQANPEEFVQYDLILLGSPSWDYQNKEGQPHEDYLPFMESARGKNFANKKFAVFGLGDSTYTIFCGAVGHLEEFIKSIGGTLVAESLKIDGFFFNQDQNLAAARAWAEKLPV